MDSCRKKAKWGVQVNDIDLLVVDWYFALYGNDKCVSCPMNCLFAWLKFGSVFSAYFDHEFSWVLKLDSTYI